MQHFGKAALRVTKNYTKGYSDTQAKVREATSNDPWGPSGTQINEIAQLTYNQNDFIEIMEMLDKRLNDKGKNWRHVFKSLTVLDYCLHEGSEKVVIYFRENAYIIKTLKEFQYIDEDGEDQGANVRQKAKDITNLLTDDTRLREECRSHARTQNRMINGTHSGDFEPGDENSPQQDNFLADRRPNRDEDKLCRAIEESQKLFAQEIVRSRGIVQHRVMNTSAEQQREQQPSHHEWPVIHLEEPAVPCWPTTHAAPPADRPANHPPCSTATNHPPLPIPTQQYTHGAYNHPFVPLPDGSLNWTLSRPLADPVNNGCVADNQNTAAYAMPSSVLTPINPAFNNILNLADRAAVPSPVPDGHLNVARAVPNTLDQSSTHAASLFAGSAHTTISGGNFYAICYHHNHH